MSLDEKYQQRAGSLLGLRRYGDDVTETDPSPAPSAVGAGSGVGYAWKSAGVAASVYLFDSYDEASAAETRLRAEAEPSRAVAGTVNGPLLMWATAAADDPEAGKLLRQLRQSFAGRERDRE
jgi:hypothetical protein